MSDSEPSFTELSVVAQRLSELLEQTQTRLVFAESCSGGLVAAALASVPGISRWLCGSAVTYQDQTKRDWLAVSAADLQQHSAVSPEVTRAMAVAVLRTTTQADLSLAVTGHLGPGAPDQGDGIIFIASLWRGREASAPLSRRIVLTSRSRAARQFEAARLVLQVSSECVAQKKSGHFSEN